MVMGTVQDECLFDLNIFHINIRFIYGYILIKLENMSTTQLLEILEKLNPWWSGKPFETGIPRNDYLNKIKEYVATKEIVIITGVRRSGKTTLLFQTIQKLIENKNINPKHILFVNFDEPDLANLENPIKSILDVYFQEICDESQVYLIFDEIQSISGWERWAKSIYDQKKHQLILSGSSSHMLDSKLASLISGRYLKVNVFPLDFEEYLVFNGLNKEDDLTNRLNVISNKNRIMRMLKDYLYYGGFPRVVLQKDEHLKREHLKTYHESIVYKDILSVHEVRHTKVLRELIHYLCSNFTSLYSYKKLGELLKVDFATVKEYLGYIEESRMLFEVCFFSYSLKTQGRNNKKIYCIDNGLRNAVSFQFSRDEGKFAENLVFVELKRRARKPYYWKGRGEVDFVLKNPDQSLSAINVSYTDNPPERETKALREFKKEFGQKKVKELILLTRDLEQEDAGIKFIPLWKWLL